LEEDKRSLEKEKARIPNQQDLDDKMKAVQKECEEIRRQIAQKKSEITDQTLLLNDKKKKLNVTAKQYEELTHTSDGFEVKYEKQEIIFLIFLFRVKSEYLQVTLRPAELLKQADTLSLQKE